MAGRFWPGEEKRAGIASPSLMNKHLNIPSDLFLTKGREIERVKRHGQRIQTPLFNLVFCEGAQPRIKAGIIVGRRLGKAVLRNRAKRIFRELVRTTQRELKIGREFLIFPKSRVLQQNYRFIVNTWRITLSQAGLLDSKPA